MTRSRSCSGRCDFACRRRCLLSSVDILLIARSNPLSHTARVCNAGFVKGAITIISLSGPVFAALLAAGLSIGDSRASDAPTNHWSLQPLRKPAIPATARPAAGDDEPRSRRDEIGDQLLLLVHLRPDGKQEFDVAGQVGITRLMFTTESCAPDTLAPQRPEDR